MAARADLEKADLKTFTALGCYGASVITALTAQNTTGVQGVYSIPPEFVESQVRIRSNALSQSLIYPRTQLRSVLDDIPVAAVKIGMLSNAGVVRAVTRTLRTWRSTPERQQVPIVIDPVCVSTSGHTLLERNAIGALIDELLPLATVLTPNESEAESLLNDMYPERPVRGGKSILDRMMHTTCELRGALARDGAVLLKLGDIPLPHRFVREAISNDGAAGSAVIIFGDECEETVLDAPEILRQAAGETRGGSADSTVVDILCEWDGDGDGNLTLFVRPYLKSKSTHGTGCTLSAALACALARGEPRAFASLLPLNCD